MKEFHKIKQLINKSEPDPMSHSISEFSTSHDFSLASTYNYNSSLMKWLSNYCYKELSNSLDALVIL